MALFVLDFTDRFATPRPDVAGPDSEGLVCAAVRQFTELDYFGARYFSGAMGRFVSPDAPFADQHPEAPQSRNMYAYSRNNQLRFTDPSGNCVAQASATEKTAADDNLKVKDIITEEKADELVEVDLPTSEKAVRKGVGELPLSQNEFNALSDLAFNVGAGVFSKEKSPNLMKAIENKDYTAMSEQLDYSRDVSGNRPAGLKTRSEARKQMFLGTYKEKKK